MPELLKVSGAGVASRSPANERDCARIRSIFSETPEGWHEARIGDRSSNRKAFAQAAPSDERQFVLESGPAVVVRLNR